MSDDMHTLAAIENLMREVTDLRRRVSKGERSHDLQRSAIDGGEGLQVIDPNTGEVAWKLSADENGVVIPQALTGPDPLTPSAPTAEPGIGAVGITWDGMDVEGNPAPTDFTMLRIHASLEEDFEPSEATRAGSIHSRGGYTAITLAPGTWFIRTEVTTQSGKVSPPSEMVTAILVPLVDEESIAEELELAADELAAAHNLAMEDLAALEARAAEGDAALADARDRISEAEAILGAVPEGPTIAERLAAAEGTLSDAAMSTDLDDLDAALRNAFQEADQETKQAAQDAKTAAAEAKEAAVAAALLRIDSSRGTAFKNNTIATVLTVTIFYAGKAITNITDLHEAFGLGAYLEWFWRREQDQEFGLISSSDNRLSNAGFSLTVSPADVDEKTVFQCHLNA